ncbi:hypothetical protein O3P69_002161 [Scylla paramamosain]|uniref:Uncharacterized protein n=1 Tax=Scylla paramamosain TaxID=85552 RepID=A0AAW0V898_SCYPA
MKMQLGKSKWAASGREKQRSVHGAFPASCWLPVDVLTVEIKVHFSRTQGSPRLSRHSPATLPPSEPLLPTGGCLHGATWAR